MMMSAWRRSLIVHRALEEIGNMVCICFGGELSKQECKVKIKDRLPVGRV